MPYSRGDVVLVLFPDSNLNTANVALRSSYKPTTSAPVYLKP